MQNEFKRLLFLVLASVALSFFSAGAIAECTQDGTYKASCSNIKMIGDTLSAHCKDVNDVSWPSTLSHCSTCQGPIKNINGHLLCLQKGQPSGSYTDSCFDVTMTGDILNATCMREKDKIFTKTSLPIFSKCMSDIRNFDGQLDCVLGKLPPGTYQQTCVGIRVEGDTLIANCRDKGRTFSLTRLVHFTNCTKGIDNQSGKLVCSKGGDLGVKFAESAWYPVCIVSPAGSDVTAAYWGSSMTDAVQKAQVSLNDGNKYGGATGHTIPGPCSDGK